MPNRLLLILSFLNGSALLQAQEQIQPQMTFSRSSAGVSSSDWVGVVKRTYFYQSSPDLANWSFAPFVAFGNGGHHYEVASSSPKYFFRLNYLDTPWISTLQQARDADFDGDGIPNAYEVEVIGSNPLNPASAGGDSDGDGLTDGWEKFYFGNLTTADPATVQSGDGLTNQEKSDLGLSPTINYSDLAAVQTAKFNYDLVGRLTGVTAPVCAAAYASDEEGNLLNTQ